MRTCSPDRRVRVRQGYFALFCCWFLAQGDPVSAATYAVTTVADSGAGSLRQAILNANANSGLDLITFNIAGTGPFSIKPTSVLPTITDPVVIDGTTQPGYAATPLIEIDGSGLGAGSDGLLITGGGSTVRGLAINRCPLDAIRLENLGTNIIQGNFLGTDPTGTVAQGNGEGGVMIDGSPGNLIGGTSASERNLISGGNLSGVFLLTSTAIGNVISGNYIGTSITGLAALGNTQNGVEIASASSNLIGGAGPGAGNVISGNGQSGIYFISGSLASNLVQGNYIGVNANGTVALGNTQDGVTINGASGNTIGGATAAARNVISGNSASGVLIWTAEATSNLVAGNYIGTDETGTVAIPNQANGVTLDGADDNIIGGTNSASGNLISGNTQDGVLITSSGATGNMVLGNFIGTDAAGVGALANAFGGVTIDGCYGNIIGASGGGNVISGNAGNGVYLVDAGASLNIISGNFIGTDATGEAPLANSLAGVYIQVPGNTIGGVTPGSGNVISGNALNGVYIYTKVASNNVLEGNFIGTDAKGETAVANGYSGVAISNAPANVIGGPVTGARNVISGNANSGINLGGNTLGTVIQGNYIGTDLTGTSQVPNYGGIYLYGSGTNLIGGLTPGAANLISGNYFEGLSVGDPGANGNTIQGNFIGTAADGISPLGNEWHNIDFLDTASNNLVGGSTPTADNRIAFVTSPDYDGVRIRAGCPGNFVSRNCIFSNGDLGIVIGANAGLNTSNLAALTAAFSDGVKTSIQGSLSSHANGHFLVQFYENVAPNPSGYGEGQTNIGSTNITTGANGQASFILTFPFAVPVGRYLSATVTDATDTTWEFSRDLAVAGPTPFSIIQSAGKSILLTNSVTHKVTTNSVPATITASWPTDPSGFVLLAATNLTPTVVWSAATNAVSTNGAATSISLVPNGVITFYRLLFQ
jgi:hypothetical protein